MAKKSALEFRSAFATYTTRKTLGEGGSGTVYSAVDDTETVVALKVLDPHKATREKLKRFRNEILFGSSERHAGILRVLDHGIASIEGKDTLFYVMPQYAKTLRDLLADKLEPSELLRLYGTLLDAVEAAHLAGVIHRDLKPENVLYDSKQRTLIVGDFGVARFAQDELYTLVQTKPGTRLANFLYAAPEQRLRGQEVDHRADIFALGLMLNELLTGDVPHGTGYRSIGSAVGAFGYLDSVVEAMIRQDPGQRPDSIDQVKQRMIAQRADFVSRQKIDRLSKRVVSEAELDDPLVRDPIRVLDVEVDDGGVKIVLNQQPNNDWRMLYQGMSGVSFYPGMDFRRFPINNRRITVSAHDDRYFQELINQSKVGIEATNRAYEQQVRRAAEQRVREEKERLQAEAEAERRRQQLRRSLRI